MKNMCSAVGDCEGEIVLGCRECKAMQLETGFCTFCEVRKVGVTGEEHDMALCPQCYKELANQAVADWRREVVQELAFERAENARLSRV